MTVHISEEKVSLTVTAFEARYDDGYRYLDHCGDTISRIRGHSPSWVVASTVEQMPKGSALQNSEFDLVLSFGMERFNIGFTKPIPLAKAEKSMEVLGREAQALYEVVVSGVRASDTTRVGSRYRFAAPADSLEEADRFVSLGARSNLSDQVLRITGSALRDAAVYYVVEERENGIRRRISIESQGIITAGAPAATGFETEGLASVGIDIDTFVKPTSGHYQKTNLFVQANYVRSRTIAMDIFQWLKLQR